MPHRTGPAADWIAVDPGNADTMFLGIRGNIMRTADGGPSFEHLGAQLIAFDLKQWAGRGFSGLEASKRVTEPWR